MAQKVEDNTANLEAAVRAAVDEAKRTERALVQSSRLATVGTLAAGIAHEVNNPIGGMQNAVNRLQQVEGLTDKQRIYLQLVHDGIGRVARTTRRLLEFSPRDARPAGSRSGKRPRARSPWSSTAPARAGCSSASSCRQNCRRCSATRPTCQSRPTGGTPRT